MARALGGCTQGCTVTLILAPLQVSRRLLSKPQDALEGVVLSVSGWGWAEAGRGALPGEPARARPSN